MDLAKLSNELYNRYPSTKPKSEGISEELAQISFSLMIEKGLTQDELAKLTNVDVKDIHRLQGGSFYMGDEFYIKVFSALGITFG